MEGFGILDLGISRGNWGWINRRLASLPSRGDTMCKKVHHRENLLLKRGGLIVATRIARDGIHAPKVDKGRPLFDGISQGSTALAAFLPDRVLRHALV
jgi:hypothetical protein